MKKLILTCALAALALPAAAKDYTVKMITGDNAGHAYRFEPDQLAIMPGDTVHFVNAQDDRHNVMFAAVPKGAQFALSPMLEKAGQTWSYTFTREGTYQYHCHPHEELGMKGVIVVGKASRPEEMQVEAEDEMPGMEAMAMTGAYGPYSMTREASGTAWVPDSTPMEGRRKAAGAWTGMAHGYVNAVYDRQGGRRGGEKTFSESMLMLMADCPLGPGKLGLKSMLSLEPAMGKSGYPLLLQTGETADGRTPLVDRQHPHDLFMELAASYSLPAGEGGSVFGYVGYPGEPALGPATFMHRFSGADNPEAPITHHWLDSTHITYGVVTMGYIRRGWKLEASVFNGREPDQFRWNFDPLRLNSYSARLTYNPADNWSVQVSHGRLKSPEALTPGTDQARTTASAVYNRPFGGNNWQTTLAWGLDANSPGRATSGALLESALTLRGEHTVFGRAEYVGKEDLHPGRVFYVGKLSAGYVYDFPVRGGLKFGLGGALSVCALPHGLRASYGRGPVSGMAFARLKL